MPKVARARAARDVDFVGLGQMGRAMAANLATAGFAVRGVDPDGDARATVEERGIPCVGDVCDLDRAAACVALCLPAPDDVLDVVAWIESLDPSLRPRHVLNLSTVGPRWTVAVERRLAQHCPAVAFVESPVSGGVLRTARRDIALLCGCREAAMIDPLRPVLDAIAKRIFVFGSARHASVAKLVNNVAAVNIALGTIEALSLGVGSGLELEDLFEVLDAGTAGSYVLSSTLTRSLLDGDLRTGFAMRLAAKDMGLALDHAAFVDVDLPHTTESLTQLDEGIEGGLGDLVFPAVALRRGLRPSTDREVTAA